MAGWHHWLDGRESVWTPGVGDGQGGLACCDSWGRKELDTTERLNWTKSPVSCPQINYPFLLKFLWSEGLYKHKIEGNTIFWLEWFIIEVKWLIILIFPGDIFISKKSLLNKACFLRKVKLFGFLLWKMVFVLLGISHAHTLFLVLPLGPRELLNRYRLTLMGFFLFNDTLKRTRSWLKTSRWLFK